MFSTKSIYLQSWASIQPRTGLSKIAKKVAKYKVREEVRITYQQVKMFQEGDIGVLPPLGVYDPLGLIGSRDMRRYEVSASSISDIQNGEQTKFK